jgi:hypothetical protein
MTGALSHILTEASLLMVRPNGLGYLYQDPEDPSYWSICYQEALDAAAKAWEAIRPEDTPMLAALDHLATNDWIRLLRSKGIPTMDIETRTCAITLLHMCARTYLETSCLDTPSA